MAQRGGESAAVAPGRSRRAKGGGTVAALLTAVSGAFLATALWTYQHYLAYRPRAEGHLPASATWAVRVDVEQVVLFEPVRKHLLPILSRWQPGVPGGAGMRNNPQAHALARRAVLPDLASKGLDLPLQLREVLVSGGGAPERGGQLGIVLAGKFPGSLLGAEDAEEATGSPSSRGLSVGAGVLEQTADTTLVWTRGAPVVRAEGGSPEGQGHSRAAAELPAAQGGPTNWGLTGAPAVAVVEEGEWLRQFSNELELGTLDRVRVECALGPELILTGKLQFRGPGARAAEARLRSLLHQADWVPPEHWRVLQLSALLAGATFEVLAEDELGLRTAVSRETLDSLVQAGALYLQQLL